MRPGLPLPLRLTGSLRRNYTGYPEEETLPTAPAVTIKIFAVEADTASPDYQKTLRRAEAVARRFPEGQVRIEECAADTPEAQRYGLVLTPTIVVNDTIIAVGKLVPAGRLLRLVQAELEEATG